MNRRDNLTGSSDSYAISKGLKKWAMRIKPNAWVARISRIPIRRGVMLTVTDIMTTDVCTIRSSAKVTQAIALMQAKHV